MNRHLAATLALALSAATAAAAPKPEDVNRCKSLAEQIDAVEKQQRQPQSAKEQDRLKADMAKLRDEQFKLKC